LRSLGRPVYMPRMAADAEVSYQVRAHVQVRWALAGTVRPQRSAQNVPDLQAPRIKFRPAVSY
jgi:hypothetical protein